MWPYVVLILLPLLIQHIEFQSSALNMSVNARNCRAMKVFWVILVVMLVLRHDGVGRDLPNYRVIFNFCATNDWGTALGRSAEIGYSALNKLVSLFTTNFYAIMIVTALLSTYFPARAYLRYSEDPSLTIALFINMSNFVLLFSTLRQCIAISLGFLAYEYVRKKKVWPYLMVVAAAVLFHTSAFMLLLMYPLYHLRITKQRLIFILPLMGVMMIFNRQIFQLLLQFLSMFTKYEAEIVSTGSYMMLFLFVVFTVFAFVIPDESKMDADTMGLRNLLLLAVVLQMFAPLHVFSMRMNYYYIIFIPLLMPKIVRCRSTRWSQIAIVARHVMVLFFVVYFFLTAPSANVLDTFPYRFFWETV